MEHLPVEVVGNILSRLGTARDAVIASATCRIWHEARKLHLHTLTFNSDDWPMYLELSTSKLEAIITQTIFQTKGLQCLSIIMDNIDLYSAASVTAWLMYTGDTLCELHYNVITMPDVNILEKCGRQKLEHLTMSNNTITGVGPSNQRFPCLKSLSLTDVSISSLDLRLLLTACPKLETLTLVGLDMVWSDPQVIMELSSYSLKDIYIEAMSLDKFILKVDSLEKLDLKDCTLEVFELIGKETLRSLKMDDVR